ncbi:haloacid dehalogenase-like hydrolase [Homoserinimonas sp. OAct 916]|uniref:haloacid dehalogenase-like hydrolase n=1 Tax=Homoserinimonas sp. OAct 916 TaxID=2211450 RepID=UPI0034CF0FD7
MALRAPSRNTVGVAIDSAETLIGIHEETESDIAQRTAPRTPARKLVLWDLDYTLLDPAGFGHSSIDLAFKRLFSEDAPTDISFAGRTDRAILGDLIRKGAPGQEARQDELQELVAALVEQRNENLVEHGGRALPGALRALERLSTEGGIIQSVLSGNLRRIGRIKVDSIGASAYLDLDVAAFGDHHEIRADLVRIAVAAAEAKYGHVFGGQDIVLIGDTPLDIEAALNAGANAIGVANGGFSVAELAAAGATVALPDLLDSEAILASVLGTHR